MTDEEGLWGEEDFMSELAASGEQAPPPQAGISFAHMARMGFAATGPSLTPTGSSPQAASSVWGPSLGQASTASALGSSPPPVSGWGPSATAWGSKGAGQGDASVRAPSTPSPPSSAAARPEAGSGKKGKKGGKNLVLLSSSAQQRRY